MQVAVLRGVSEARLSKFSGVGSFTAPESFEQLEPISGISCQLNQVKSFKYIDTPHFNKNRIC